MAGIRVPLALFRALAERGHSVYMPLAMSPSAAEKATLGRINFKQEDENLMRPRL